MTMNNTPGDLAIKHASVRNHNYFIEQHSSLRSEFNGNYKSVYIDSAHGPDVRKYYVSLNFGFREAIGLGLGYQYSDMWSYTGKISIANKDNAAFAISGLGIRIARHFTTFLIFNNINIQPTVILLKKERTSYPFGLYGFSFEAGIGNESIEMSEFSFFWNIGGIVSIIKKEKPLFSPDLKLGVNWNF